MLRLGLVRRVLEDGRDDRQHQKGRPPLFRRAGIPLLRPRRWHRHPASPDMTHGKPLFPLVRLPLFI
jgi:hypothetical protein